MGNAYGAIKRDHHLFRQDREEAPWQKIVCRDTDVLDKFPHRLDTLAQAYQLARKVRQVIGPNYVAMGVVHWDSIYPQTASHRSEEMRDFTTLTRSAGVVVDVKSDCSLVYLDDEVVKMVPHNLPYSSLLVNLEVYLQACSRLTLPQCSKLQSAFPHPNSAVLQYYDYAGVRVKGAEDLVPETIFGALTREQYAVNQLEEELFELHAACLVGDFGEIPRVSVAEAVATLEDQRVARRRWEDRGGKSKAYMYPGPAHNNTVWKFVPERDYDVVVHPGAGRTDRLSRRAFRTKTICIDPSSDDKAERMTFKEYALKNPVLEGDAKLVCSDMSVYNDLGMMTQLSNQLAADACEYAIANGADYLLKVGLSTESELPAIFKEPIFEYHKKPRLHNAEVIVKKGHRTLMDIFQDVAFVVKRSNELRELMTASKQWPKRLYSDLAPFLPPLPDEVLVVYPDDKIFQRQPSAGIFDPHDKAYNDFKPCFGEMTIDDFIAYPISDINYDQIDTAGSTAYEVVIQLRDKCSWMKMKEAYAHLANMAVEYGYHGSMRLAEIVFEY